MVFASQHSPALVWDLFGDGPFLSLGHFSVWVALGWGVAKRCISLGRFVWDWDMRIWRWWVAVCVAGFCILTLEPCLGEGNARRFSPARLGGMNPGQWQKDAPRGRRLSFTKNDYCAPVAAPPLPACAH